MAYFSPNGAQTLAIAPFHKASQAFVKGQPCECSTLENLPSATKKATLPLVNTIDILRMNATTNGQTFDVSLNLPVSAVTTTAADIARLRDAITDNEKGLRYCLVGGGEQLAIAVQAGNLEISITSTSEFVANSVTFITALGVTTTVNFA